MATVTPIPLTTLVANQTVNVPSQSVAGFSHGQLLVNRNVGANSLDSTPSASLTLQLDYSKDGGATWAFLMSATVPGGPIVVRGTQLTASSIDMDFFPDTTHVRGSVVNGSAQVSVSGSLTLS